jgi:hypothetical protein
MRKQSYTKWYRVNQVTGSIELLSINVQAMHFWEDACFLLRLKAGSLEQIAFSGCSIDSVQQQIRVVVRAYHCWSHHILFIVWIMVMFPVTWQPGFYYLGQVIRDYSYQGVMQELLSHTNSKFSLLLGTRYHPNLVVAYWTNPSAI